MTITKLDYRGRAATRPEDRVHLEVLAEQFPAGARIIHECGREGTVRPDQPAHVPGVHNDGQTTVCLAGQQDEPMVFASWDNEFGFTWCTWAPVGKVRLATAQAANRPGNKARIGGRR